MGIRILAVDGGGKTCLYDSVTDWAFGPVAEEETLNEFLEWCDEQELPDLRGIPDDILMAHWNLYLEQFPEVPNETLSVVPEEG